MTSSLDKLASNLCGTSEVQCDKSGDDMELIKFPTSILHYLGVRDAEQKRQKT